MLMQYVILFLATSFFFGFLKRYIEPKGVENFQKLIDRIENDYGKIDQAIILSEYEETQTCLKGTVLLYRVGTDESVFEKTFQKKWKDSVTQNFVVKKDLYEDEIKPCADGLKSELENRKDRKIQVLNLVHMYLNGERFDNLDQGVE